LTDPVFSPVANQRWRCALVPWVKLSGTTAPPGALQRIVANAGGRVHGLFHIALLQDLAGILRMVGPHARKTVGLQLQPHTQRVVLGLADPPRISSIFRLMPSRFCTWWPTSCAIT
jgi:hypothetical protein